MLNVKQLKAMTEEIEYIDKVMEEMALTLPKWFWESNTKKIDQIIDAGFSKDKEPRAVAAEIYEYYLNS